MGAVVITPEPHFQFLDPSGKVLSNGFIYTFDAGTSNLRNTYADSTGLVQNPNPIPLDATGAPTNGSVQTGIWLGNQAYKFVAYNSSMVQMWVTDNISGSFGLLNLVNVWSQLQTFTQPIYDSATGNQLVLGANPNQTTADFPPPVGAVTLHFPNTADTMVGRATTDTLTNKTLTSPVVTGGTFATPSLNVLKDTTQITQTGDVALHTIYTITIPGGVMGLTNQLRITLVFGANVIGAGGVTIFINYGGTRISPNSVVPVGFSNSNGLFIELLGGNVGATNTQSWDCLLQQAFGGSSPGNLNHATSLIDSTVSQNLTVTYQGAAGTDSVTFYRCLVEIL